MNACIINMIYLWFMFSLIGILNLLPKLIDSDNQNTSKIPHHSALQINITPPLVTMKREIKKTLVKLNF